MKLLVLQPHCDDAAFSIHGMLSQVSKRPHVTLVTVYSVSDHAPNVNTVDVDVITALRGEEDLAWFRSLELEGLRFDLGMKEAPLRGRPVQRGDGMLNVLREEVDAVAAALPLPAGIGEFVVLVPFGLSGHTDHWTVRFAAELLYGRDNVVLYEDLPGAAHADVPVMVAANPHQLHSRRVAFDMKQKLSACRMYESQVQEEWLDAIQARDHEAGGEVLWSSSRAALTALGRVLLV